MDRRNTESSSLLGVVVVVEVMLDRLATRTLFDER
jgi:hypothetical protein